MSTTGAKARWDTKAVWVITALLGAAFTYGGWLDQKVARIADARPQTLTAAELIANGCGANAHVVVTGCVAIEDELVIASSGRRSSSSLEVWVPCISDTTEWFEDEERPRAFCLRFARDMEIPEVRAALSATTFRGVVINDTGDLTGSNRGMLNELFPREGGIGQVRILEVGRTPNPWWPLLVVVGGAAALGGTVMALVRHRQENPPAAPRVIGGVRRENRGGRSRSRQPDAPGDSDAIQIRPEDLEPPDAEADRPRHG